MKLCQLVARLLVKNLISQAMILICVGMWMVLIDVMVAAVQ
jgi:hypothetical protein